MGGISEAYCNSERGVGAIRFAIAPYAAERRGKRHCQELFFGQSEKLWAAPVKFSPPGYEKFSRKIP
jgi:hypothetical protein